MAFIWPRHFGNASSICAVPRSETENRSAPVRRTGSSCLSSPLPLGWGCWPRRDGPAARTSAARAPPHLCGCARGRRRRTWGRGARRQQRLRRDPEQAARVSRSRSASRLGVTVEEAERGRGRAARDDGLSETPVACGMLAKSQSCRGERGDACRAGSSDRSREEALGATMYAPSQAVVVVCCCRLGAVAATAWEWRERGLFTGPGSLLQRVNWRAAAGVVAHAVQGL